MKTQNISASIKKIVKVIRMFILLPSVTIMLAGCGTWVLRADFDNYIPESSILEGPIPGNPDGDHIENVAQPVRVLAGSPNNVVQVGDLHESGRIEFVAVPHDPPEQYRIDWDGNRVTDGTGNTFITFRDDDGIGTGNQVFMLRFSVEHLVVLINGNDDIIEPITYSPHQSHAILIVIDMNNPKSVEIRFEENENVSQRTFSISQDITSLTSITFDAHTFGDYQIADLDIFAEGSL